MIRRAVIAGAGPAGLTCALYLAKAGWKVDVFSNEESTESCLAEANVIQNYPGFPEGINGLELLELFKEQAENSGAVIHPEGLKKVFTEDKAVIDTSDEMHPYDEYIEAVGCRRREYSCTGLDLIPVHYCAVCDGGLYGKDDSVIVIGGGDTAISSALYLSNIVGKVSMLVRKPYCRYTNKQAFDELCSKENVEIMYETQLYHVSSDASGNPIVHLSKNGNYADYMLLGIRGVFVCIGYDVNSVERIGNGNVWKCGDCIEEQKQVAIAVGSGAKVALEIIKA